MVVCSKIKAIATAIAFVDPEGHDPTTFGL